MRLGKTSVATTWLVTAAIALACENKEPSDKPANSARPTAVCGRPVRVVSVAMHGKGLERTAAAIDRAGAEGADVILMTEAWQGFGKISSLDDEAMTRIAGLAKKHRTYIVSPIYRREGDVVYNSAVLFDRQGKVAGFYNKVFPVMDDPPGVNCEFPKGVKGRPGKDVVVFDTDFGRLGIAICFDGQFPEVWQRLADKGAQLVLFASAYSGGRTLGAYATLYHYYIVSSCCSGECQAYDTTGERLLDERRGVSRITLDLDRRMIHNNDSYNYRGQEKRLLAENPGVIVDKRDEREDWHVLRAVEPGVDLPALLKKYDVQLLREYMNKQRQKTDALREKIVD